MVLFVANGNIFVHMHEANAHAKMHMCRCIKTEISPLFLLQLKAVNALKNRQTFIIL